MHASIRYAKIQTDNYLKKKKAFEEMSQGEGGQKRTHKTSLACYYRNTVSTVIPC